GRRARSSGPGTLASAANELSQSEGILLSYPGEGPETVIFNLADRAVKRNFKSLEDLVRHLDGITEPETAVNGGTVVWRGVPPEVVSEFVASYETDRMAQRVRPRLIAKYIEQCAKVGELGNWTVCLVGKSAASHVDVAGHSVGPVTRAPLNPEFRTEGRYTIRRVLRPPGEGRDVG